MSRKRSSEVSESPAVAESRADKFRRLGNRRLANAVKALRNLARLGNRKVYDYTDEQHALVMQTIRECVERLHHAFAESVPTSNGETNYF